MLEFIFSWRINGWTVLRQVGDHDIAGRPAFNFYECAFVTLAPAKCGCFIRYGADDPVAGSVNYDRALPPKPEASSPLLAYARCNLA